MSLRRASQPRSPKLRSYVPSLLMAVLCVYFSFYLMFGPRGYFALQRVNEQLAEKNAEFTVLKDKRDRLESDVHLMRPDSLDPDMADEQARKNLGYMKPDEVIIDMN